MCLSVPGKIVKISNGRAIVKYAEEEREAAIVDASMKVGDYVIVQGKICIQKVPKKEAEDFYELISKEG
jgi:hydrogenase maturation factor